MKTLRFALVLSPLVLAGCGSSEIGAPTPEAVKQVVKDEAKGAQKSLQGLQGAVMSGSKLEGGDAQGRPLWRLEAREIRAAGDLDGGVPRQATLTDAKAILFRAGVAESSFQAKTIRLFKVADGLRLAMSGGVKARSEGLAKGGAVEFQAPRADVDVAKRVVAASGGVQVSRGAVRVKSANLRAQTGLETVDLSGGVSSTNGSGVMNAQSARYEWKKNRLSAQKVTAKRGDLTLAGAILEADTDAQSGVLRGQVSARNSSGTASAPRLNFNWKRDELIVPDSTFTSAQGTLRARDLRTDSKLKVTRASGVRLEKDGAVLVASSINGFQSLSQLSAVDVQIQRAGASLRANRAQATNWNEPSGRINASGNVELKRGDLVVRAPQAQASNWTASSTKLVASGGVVARNARGTVSANQATWTGGANGVVDAIGNVIIRAGDTVLRGARGQSDGKFARATMSGGVSVSSPRGTARAQQATWTGGKSGRIQANGNVEIRSGGAVLLGSSGSSDANFQRAALVGNVRATLRDGSTLRAPKVEKIGEQVFATNAIGTFKSGASLGTLTLRAPLMESRFDGATASASGGVLIQSTTGATARAPRALYNRRTQKVTASGGVTFSDPARGLSQRGDTLVADLGLKQVTLSNSSGQGDAKLFEGKTLFD